MGRDEETVHREAVVVAREDALRKIADGSTVDLRVALTTKYRTDDYDDCCCCTVKTAMAAAADLRVDGFGKVAKEPIIKTTRFEPKSLKHDFYLSCNSLRFDRFMVLLCIEL